MAENQLVDQQLAFILSCFKTGIDSGMLKVKNLREDYFDKASAKLLKQNLGVTNNSSLFEIKGMSSEEMKIFFEYTGINPVGHRQMSDGTYLLAIDNREIKRAYNLAIKLNKGEITFEELKKILEEKNRETEPETELDPVPDPEEEQPTGHETDKNDKEQPVGQEEDKNDEEWEEEPDFEDEEQEPEKILEEDKHTINAEPEQINEINPEESKEHNINNVNSKVPDNEKNNIIDEEKTPFEELSSTDEGDSHFIEERQETELQNPYNQDEIINSNEGPELEKEYNGESSDEQEYGERYNTVEEKSADASVNPILQENTENDSLSHNESNNYETDNYESDDFESKDYQSESYNDNKIAEQSNVNDDVLEKNAYPVSEYELNNENNQIDSYEHQENSSGSYQPEVVSKENDSYSDSNFYTESNYEKVNSDIYENEKKQQEEIISRTEEERISHENTTVYDRGNAASLENYSSSAGTTVYNGNNNSSNYSQNNSNNNSSESINGYDSSKPASQGNTSNNLCNIQINKLNLVNEHYHEKDTSIIQKAGEAITKPIEGAKETTTWQGYHSFTNVTSVAELLACSSTNKKLGELESHKLYNKQKDNGFASLNKMLDEKKVSGFYNNNGIYGLKNGVDFSTVENATNSRESLLNFLEKKGLAHYDKKMLQTGGWDTSKFDLLLKRGRYNDIAKILKLSPNMPESQKRAIIKEMAMITKGANYGKDAKKLRGNSAKRLLGNLLKDSKDNATYRGFKDIKKTTKVARKTIKVALIMTSGAAGLAIKASKSIIKHTGLKNTKLGSDILNRNTKIQQLHDRIVNREKRKISRKAEKRQNRIAKRQEKLKKKDFERLKRYKKRYGDVAGMKRFKRFRNFRKGKNKFINAAVGAVGAVLKAPGRIIRKIFGVFNKIKKILLLVIGGLFLLFFLLSCFMLLISSFVTCIFSFFTTDNENVDTSVMSVYESTAGKVLNELIDAESQWVNGLKNITEENIDLSSLNYGTDGGYTFEQYCSVKLGLRTEGKSIIAPNPFTELNGLPDAMYKRISKPDFSTLEFENASGGYTRTSNIKEILSLCATYFGNMDNLSEYQDDVTEPSDTFWTGIKNAIMKINGKINPWLIQPNVAELEKEHSAYVMTDYCLTLFNVSHQEQLDMSVDILPTKQQLLAEGCNEADLVDGKYCPSDEYDGYGCMVYDKFWYKNNHIYVDGSTEGTIIDVTDKVHPINENDNCSLGDASTGSDFEDTYMNHKNCWEWTYSREYDRDNTKSKEEIVEDKNEKSSSFVLDDIYIESVSASSVGNSFSSELKSICEANNYVFKENAVTITKINNETYKVFIGAFNDPAEYTKEYEETDKDGNKHKYKETYTKIYKGYLTFTHKCQKNHTACYCGGHLTIDITGFIYGLTDAEIASTDDASSTFKAMVPDLGFNAPNFERIEKMTSNEVDTAKFPLMKKFGDIFYADSCIIRTVTPKEWEGWTHDNMDIAINKYNQDWEELYGIAFASELGGKALSAAEKAEILETLKINYPTLSQERLNVISEGLNWVGNIGYSQDHHNCKLEGPCNRRSDGQACHLSDCSGFTSNLWRNRFGGSIYTTVSFRSTFEGTSKWRGKYNASTITPGDIIIHYDNSEDGANHALLYLGKIYPDDDTEYSIDCSTVDGVGSVFLRHRNYYPSCYVLAPDK